MRYDKLTPKNNNLYYKNYNRVNSNVMGVTF